MLHARSCTFIRSMTKLITTFAVLMCNERALLDLDEPMEKYIPEFRDPQVYVSGEGGAFVTRPATVKPTIRHMLTHTSGTTGYGLGALYGKQHPVEKLKKANGDLGAWDLLSGNITHKYPTLASWIAADASYPLLFEPGITTSACTSL